MRNTLLHKTINGTLAVFLILMQNVIALVAVPLSVYAANTDAELVFTELGTHPQAAAKPVPWQREITELAIFNEQLLAGYGDYDGNIGPIDINPFDIATSSFRGVAATFPSESIANWRHINGKLYTTTIDARGCANCASGYAVSSDGITWQLKNPVTALHIFDIATLTGSDLWLFGASGTGDGVATVWRSQDDGETWEVVDTPSTGGQRYYWGQTLNGRLYFQAFGGDQENNPMQIFDGTNWSTGTTTPICYAGDYKGGPNPVVYDNKIVCNWTDHLRTFDGTAVTELELDALAVQVTQPGSRLSSGVNTSTAVIDSAFYMLDASQSFNPIHPEQILRSPDLLRWQSLQGLPSGTTAFAIDEATSKIYVGTGDAKLYVADLPALPELPYPEEPEEPLLPNEDMNDDGVADADQPNVRIITSAVTGKPVVLELSGECAVQTLTTISEGQATAQDDDFSYADGVLDFTASCNASGTTTSISIFYYDVSATDATIRKYNPSTGTYQTIDSATLQNRIIDGRMVTVAQYSVTDGGDLDADSLANGIIVDPVGLGILAATDGSGTTSGSSSGGSPTTQQLLAASGSYQLTIVALAATTIIGTLSFLLRHTRTNQSIW